MIKESKLTIWCGELGKPEIKEITMDASKDYDKEGTYNIK